MRFVCDCWIIFLINKDNQLGGVDSDFNCWGYKENYELDDKVAKFMIDHANSKYFKNNMVLSINLLNRLKNEIRNRK